MNKKTLSILLIEDNPGDARIVKELLFEVDDPDVKIHIEHDLKSGTAFIDKEIVDVILLDLNLPDSEGLETFMKINNFAPHIPVVILSGFRDEARALKAVELGAQDYLVKDQVTPKILYKSLKYAVERHKLLLKIKTFEFLEQSEREYKNLDGMTKPELVSTPDTYGMLSLRESYPELFNILLKNYKVLINKAVEYRIKGRDDSVSESLIEIAGRLGEVMAKPRDVIELHLNAIREITEATVSSKKQVYLEEGRIMVLELMGNLVSYYRTYYFPRSSIEKH